MTLKKIHLMFFLNAFFIISFSPQALWSQAQFNKINCPWSHTLNKSLHVLFVQDGDTLTLVDSEGRRYKSRLVGIDTPESYFLGESQGLWAHIASDRLKALLPKNTVVEVEYDNQKCDPNGRLLIHIYKNKEHINRIMVEEGLAVNYCLPPNEKYCDEFGNTAQKNFDQKNGFFEDPTVEIPYLFRVNTRGGNFVYYVGHRDSKKVVTSNEIETIPLGKRVIFYNKKNIRPPYFFSN